MRSQVDGTIRFGKLTALLAAASATVESTAEAVDLEYYNSPVFSQSNTVGWMDGGPMETSFIFELKDTNRAFFRAFAFNAGALQYHIVGSATNEFSSFFWGLKPRANLNTAFQIFEAGSDWNDAAQVNSVGFAGWLTLIPVYNNLITRGMIKPPAVDKYFLFKFNENLVDYYGWINVDTAVYWDVSLDGTFMNLYVTVHQYAWQRASYGMIQAGATAVPEPATLVTSGIAALAGGAVALRRWRKERKAKTGSA